MNRKLLSLAVASCFAADLALANPTGPSVVSGSAAFATAGSTLTVTNSPNAIINWQGFSIASGEATRFQQQSAASAVLNRVVGQDPSAILGTLSSNGRVFLVNPNGILFGQGSRVDVAGLVASTLNITDGDFLGGRLNFQAGAISNSIVNQGEIVSSTGGRIYLIAPDIQNHGLISSPGGEVVLAAGKTVKLVDADVPSLQVEIEAGGSALNVGQILTEGGKAGIYAGLINQRGIVRADSVSQDATGRIVFRASDTTLLEAGSVTSAAGARGGEIQVLGNKVGLTGDARVDASGESGGGTVLVGGDFQGKNPEIQNAYRTYVGPQSSVRADAIMIGDGGKVIVWSDDATRAYGTISARGGAQGGNGGFVEVSGKNWLDFQGRVDTSAAKGAAGTLLLDPSDVDIVSGSDTLAGGAGFDSGNPNKIFTGGSGASSISWGTIKTHLTTTNGGTNVIITTSPTFGGQCSPGGACGDIDIINDSPDLASSKTLRLLAYRNINVTGGGITNSGGGALELRAGWDENTATPGQSSNNFGTITITKPINLSGAVPGDLLLYSNLNIADGGTGVITARNLLASTNSIFSNSVLLNSNTHMVDVIAGKSSDQFLFKNGKLLEIGAVAGVNGIDVTAPSGLSDATINVQLTSGALTVNQPVSATASEQGGTASITLIAPGGITVNNVLVKAAGGDDTSISAAVGGTATVQMLSGGNLEFVGAAAAVQAAGGATPNDTLAGSGASDITLEVSTASGNGSPSGDIKVQAVTADKVNLQQKSTTTGKGILRASGTSLITANTELLMEVDIGGDGIITGGPSGSIGTSAEPMRIQTPILEAHTHEASDGIFVESPNAQNLQIGGGSLVGSVKGVQDVVSGDIVIAANTSGPGQKLTLQSGSAPSPGPCGVGATGGPVCTASGDITLRADDMDISNVVKTGSGTVTLTPYSTTRNVYVATSPFVFATPIGLVLHTSELAFVSANTLEIGRSTDSGSLQVNNGSTVAPFDISAFGTVRLAHEYVFIQTNITKTSGADATLDVRAKEDISSFSSADITSTSNKLHVILNSDRDANGSGAISLGLSTVITSNGGDITLGGGADPLTTPARGNVGTVIGVQLDGAQLLSGAGNINVSGRGHDGSSNNDGVRLVNGAVVSSAGGAISITGTGGAGTSSDNVGIRISGSGTLVQTTGSGNIMLTGQGGGGTDNNNGIRVENSALVSSAGTLTVDGTGVGTNADNSGIKVSGATLQSVGLLSLIGQGGLGTLDNNDGVRLESGMVSGTGDVTVEGTGGTGGNDTVGIKLSGGTVQSTGGGTVTLIGQGGPGGDNNNGVRLESGAMITTAGSILVGGIAAGSGNHNSGVKLSGGTVQSTGGGTVTLDGQAGAGVDNNDGVRLEGSATVSTTGLVIVLGAGAGSGSNNFGVNVAGGSITGTVVAIDGSGAGTAPAVVLNGITASGALIVMATGEITQTGAVTAGSASFDAGTNPITLMNPSNNFAGAVGLTGTTVSITDANVLTFGAVSTSSLTANAGNSINVSGLLDAGSGTLTAPTVNVLLGGKLMGIGTIFGNVNNSEGTVAPGASTGILTINGDYDQRPSGTLDMQIGGLSAGSQYDQLVVNGNVTLAGTLNTALVNGFAPVSGDTFTLIKIPSAGVLSGTFSTINNQPPGTLFNNFYGPTTFEFIAAASGSVPAAIAPTFNYTIFSTEQFSEPLLELIETILEGLVTTTPEGTLVQKPPACQ